MNNKNFEYHPLSKEELQAVWEKQKEFIEGFISSNEYDADSIYINKDAVLAIIVKVDQRRRYFEFFHHLEMSEYKEAALNSFWYVKLHPVNFKGTISAEQQSQIYDSINEKLALYIIIKTLRVMLEKKHLSTKALDALPSSYLDELIYTLTYRDISKEALIILVESIAIFLGLDPYAKG
ncbi:MAG: hypothetical protein NC489_36820 [Ruminococcus flavefaciens]|nr:hypothetical protein [Ruminococcus flavefaciens]